MYEFSIVLITHIVHRGHKKTKNHNSIKFKPYLKDC